MKFRRMLIAATAGLSLVLAGCATDDGGDSTAETTQAQSSESRVLETTTGELKLDAMPERIAVLDYASLDTLVSLGFKDRVVATSKAAVMPDFADGLDATAGSLKEPDLEAIAAADPDLIIIGSRQSELTPEFEKIAPTANMSIDYDHYTVENNLEHVEALGKLFDLEDEAKQATDEIRERVASINDAVKPEQEEAVVMMTNGGEISLFGEDSRFGLVFNDLGFVPAGGIDSNTPHGENASFELVKKLNPATMFIIDRDAAIGEEGHTAKATLDNDLVKATDAAKNDREFMLSSADWYLNGGGIETMNRMLDDIEAATK